LALETLLILAEEKFLDNSSIVTELALDNFTNVDNEDSEDKVERFQEIKALQKKIQSTM
jgi:hypothetical protein